MPVNFYLEGRADRRRLSPIRVSITVKGVRIITTTGLKINRERWDSSRQRARRSAISVVNSMALEINGALSRIAAHFTALENAWLCRAQKPRREELLAEYRTNFRIRCESASSSASLRTHISAFVGEMTKKRGWSESTKGKFAVLASHLEEFRRGLTPDSFDTPTLTSFVSYLLDVKKMRNSSVTKLVSLLKWFLRWTSANGLTQCTDFMNFVPKLKRVRAKVIFLEWDELMRLVSYNVPPNGTLVHLTDASGRPYSKVMHDAAALAKTRDIFCFCCLTSLRYSDALNLKTADLSRGALTITTIKTTDTVTIELNDYARAIADRHLRQPQPGGWLFPRLSCQKMNVYLKSLCEFCGINSVVSRSYFKGGERIDESAPKYQMVSTHTGRRTFICNALMLGIPPEIVMKWTGHSDYKAMRPYIDVTSQAKAQAMAKFNDRAQWSADIHAAKS